MKLRLANKPWLRRQLEEPDLEVGAGREIRSSADIVEAIEALRERLGEKEPKHS